MLLFVWVFFLFKGAYADEFRYYHAGYDQGISNTVIDSKGKKTLIIFTEDSDAESLALVDALQEGEMAGTPKAQILWGAHFDQRIIVTGEFASVLKPHQQGPIPADWCRDFKLTGIKIVFPFYRFVTAPKGNEIDGPFLIEVHLGMNTLFPDGLKVHKNPIDLKKHSLESPEK